MDIVVFGAGAIGSFFGGKLSKKHNVVLVGRADHVNKINKNGLQIKGKTQMKKKITAVENIKNISFSPDLLILTVKAFDTLHAITKAKQIITSKTTVLTFQNGLNNINQIKKAVPEDQIIAGVTTHGVQFIKPGIIHHRGEGSTIIGEPFLKDLTRVKPIASCFKDGDISVQISTNILEDIWKKAIVNACINPITTIFQCPNGELAKNPILTTIIEKLCKESTLIAQKVGFSFDTGEVFDLTMTVINQTKNNCSSMLQSVKQGKKTEIDEINGTIAKIGKTHGCNVQLNELLTHIIKKIK